MYFHWFGPKIFENEFMVNFTKWGCKQPKPSQMGPISEIHVEIGVSNVKAMF